jgi:hypothetical protein
MDIINDPEGKMVESDSFIFLQIKLSDFIIKYLVWFRPMLLMYNDSLLSIGQITVVQRAFITALKNKRSRCFSFCKEINLF